MQFATEEMEETLESLDYVGYHDISIMADGSWVAPASADYHSEGAIAKWTTQGYRLQD